MAISETSDGKIHILYLVKYSPGVSYQMLMDKCLESLYFDFFTFSSCYNELVAGNLLDRSITDTGTGEVIGSNETITITRGGEAILEDVEGTLNLQTLGYLKKAASELASAVITSNEVKAFMKPASSGKGMTITLSTVRDGINFTCTFDTDTEEEAERIIGNWRKDSSSLFKDFIGKLLK